MAIVTCLVGLHYGHIIVHFKVINILCFISFASPQRFSFRLCLLFCVFYHTQSHRDRILHWMIPSTCLIAFGLGLDFLGKWLISMFIDVNLIVLLYISYLCYFLVGMHVNKALYTFSYMCVTAGAAGFLFAGTYMLVISISY